VKQIKDILPNVLQGCKKRSLHRYEGFWQQCAGRVIAQHTEARFFKNKKLYITVDSTALLYELKTQKNDLVQKIQHISNRAVHDITFKVGEPHGRR